MFYKKQPSVMCITRNYRPLCVFKETVAIYRYRLNKKNDLIKKMTDCLLLYHVNFVPDVLCVCMLAIVFLSAFLADSRLSLLLKRNMLPLPFNSGLVVLNSYVLFQIILSSPKKSSPVILHLTS